MQGRNETPIPRSASESKVNQFINRNLEDINDSKLFGLLGLQDAREVISFVKSPEGKALQSHIQQEILILEAQEKQSAFAAEQEYLQKIRMLGILMLMRQDLEDKAQRLNQEITQGQRDKLLHRLMKNSPSQANQSAMLDAYRQTLSDYTALREDLSNTLQTQQAQLKQINGQIAAIQQAMPAAKNVFNQAMSTPIVQNTNQQIQAAAKLPLQAQIQHIGTAHQQAQAQAQANAQARATAQKIATLQAPTTITFAQQLNNQNTQVRDQIAEIYSMQRLRDEHNHLTGGQLYTANGEQTDDHDKAAYITPAHQKLVSDDGKLYLLERNQDLADLNPDERESAKFTEQRSQDYYTASAYGQYLQDQFVAARQEMLAERETARSTCEADIDKTKARIETVDAQIIDLKSRIQEIEQADRPEEEQAHSPQRPVLTTPNSTILSYDATQPKLSNSIVQPTQEAVPAQNSSNFCEPYMTMLAKAHMKESQIELPNTPTLDHSEKSGYQC